MINTFNKNLSLRYNGKFKLNKWVTITEDVVWKNNESRSKDTDSGYTGVVAAAMYMPASATVYNPLDGTYGGTTTEDPDYIAKYGSNFADIHGDAVNPVRLLEAENRYDRTSDELNHKISGAITESTYEETIEALTENIERIVTHKYFDECG